MIRFVYIGDQIREGKTDFAFFNTMVCSFVVIGGYEVFGSIDDLRRHLKYVHGDELPRKAEYLVSMAESGLKAQMLKSA